MTWNDGRDTDDGLTVGVVAQLVGVSVRTLHHWDAVGLLRPSGRTAADYRVYSGADIARLQRVLVYRELGIPLAQIGALLDDPQVDEGEQLRRQRDLLTGRISRLQQMVCAVDRMMEVRTMGTSLTPQEQAEIFGSDWDPAWQDEAQERWGDTPQWAQSQERTAHMSKADWQGVQAEGEQLNADLGAAKRAGVQPGSDEANALAERHRDSIARFYDCSHAMQVCLARMYTCDQRFTDTYEKVEPGLAGWLYDVVAANARAHGVDPETATWE